MKKLEELIYEVVNNVLNEIEVQKSWFVYGLKTKAAPQKLIKQITDSLKSVGPDIPEKIEDIFNDKNKTKDFLANKVIFIQDRTTETEANFTVHWAPNKFDMKDIKASNDAKKPVGTIANSIPLFSITQPYETDKKKDWLITREEALKCETSELFSLQQRFLEEKISRTNPATIVITSSEGQQMKFENVAWISKSSNKAGSADFVFLDSDSNIIPNSGISHKCLGFERYNGYKTFLKKLSSDSKLKEFINKIEAVVNKNWINDAINNDVKSGYWAEIDNESHSLDLIYGNDSKIIMVSDRGGMKLINLGNNTFSLVAIGESKKKGNSKVLIYPELPPKGAGYEPILLVRYGSGGSPLTLNGLQIADLTEKLASGATPSDQIKIKKLKITVPATIAGATIGLRYFIAPKIRATGVEIKNKVK